MTRTFEFLKTYVLCITHESKCPANALMQGWWSYCISGFQNF